MRKKKWAAGFLLLSVLIMACGASSINIKVQKAAEVDMPGVKKIAIVDFKGTQNSGSQIATLVQSMLMESRHFSIMEREKINSLLAEQHLAMSGIVDESTAAEVGAMLGVDAMIFGEVTAYRVAPDKRISKKVKEQKFTGKYKYISKTNKKTGKVKKVREKIYEDVWVTKTYYIRQGSVSINFRVVNVKTGELLAAHSDSESYDSSKGKSQYSLLNSVRTNLKPKGEILNKLSSKICRRFVKMIAPYYVNENRVIESGKGSIDQGKKLAEAGLWPEAIDSWKNSVVEFPKEPAGYYNLGLAFEVDGQLRKAEALYKKALSIKAKKLYMNALSRVRLAMKDKEKLQKQLQGR